MNLAGYYRIIIIGCGGSGKSTLASELGKIIHIPVIHLDKEFWNPGWKETPRPLWIVKQESLISKEKWIIDGNYTGTMELRFSAADLVIFLDINTITCTISVIKRWITNIGKTRIDMGNGCPEKIDFEFLRWIWSYSKKQKPKIMVLHEKYKSIPFIVLKSRKQIKELLEGVKGGMENAL